MAKDKKEKDINKYGMRRELTRLATVPILILGIVLIFITYFRFYQVIGSQVSKELEDVAIGALYNNSDLYHQDRTFTKGEDGLYKMDAIEGQYKNYEAYLDYMKEYTDTDITLFYYDIRVATTICDAEGNRVVGTTASKPIVDKVTSTKRGYFIDNVDIFGTKYFAYYHPVLDEDGEFKGMIFTGRPNAEVKKLIMVNTWPIIAAALLMMLLVSIGATRVATGYATVIDKLKVFLTDTAGGDFKANLDAEIIKRKDELGQMGLLTVRVQKNLRDMVEKDALTRVFCRRIGEVKIRATQDEYINNGAPYCVVMGDIDHFKNFNDTYGHDCGDLVLQSVASIFNKLVFGHGYAIRWGGEEFILIFENSSLDKGLKLLESIREAVLENELIYKEERLKITMTYGILAGDDRAINVIMKDVDELLYEGKEAGRNRIVVSHEETIAD